MHTVGLQALEQKGREFAAFCAQHQTDVLVQPYALTACGFIT
jgi:hypothetical protein